MCVCVQIMVIYIVCSGYAFRCMSDFETLPMLLYTTSCCMMEVGCPWAVRGVEDNF